MSQVGSAGNVQATKDYTTTEIENACLRVRGDLRFSLRTYEGEACYLIEDPANSRFFRIGLPEYILISMFDGETTVEEAAAATAAALRDEAFNGEQVAQICKWLVESGLALTSASQSAGRMYEDKVAATEKKSAGRFSNPIMLQTTFGNPDRVAGQLTRCFGWLFSSRLLAIWLLICGYGLYLVCSNWERFAISASSVFAKSNWILLLAAWLGMKLIHECSHAMVCKRYGGSVNKFGVVWLMFVPMPFVDVTSSWSFDSRRRRIMTAAAGMIAEMFVAAIAAIVWINTDPGLLNQTAANIVITGSIVTLLFNANPLMRFDGYYILTDILNTPNLATHSRQWLNDRARGFFLGIESTAQDWPEGRLNLVRGYALASFGWRMLISTSLLIAATNLLEGIGLLLAILAAVMWFGLPIARFLKFLVFGSKTSSPNRLQFAVRAGTLALLTVATLILVPGPSTIRAPAIVDYEQVSNVRSLTPGFVTDVFVTTGQRVNKGDLLALMKNEELVAELLELQIKSEVARQQARVYQEEDDVVAWQIAQGNLTSLEKQITELQQLVDGLAMRAPESGQIVSADLDSFNGIYMQRGEVFCRIASADRMIVNAMVAQQDIKSVRGTLKSDVRINVWGFASGIQGTIDRIAPRATNELNHQALAAPSGGPLAVISTRNGRDEQDAQPDWRLVEPRVKVKCAVKSRLVNRMQAGQLAEVELYLRDETLGHYLWNSFRHWLSDKLNINHGV